MRIKVRIVLLFLVLLTEAFSLEFTELEKFIEEARIQRNIPAVAVSIVQDDRVVFAKGFGVVKVGSSDKTNENTIFQIASISKTFTSAGLGKQVDQKRLGWDDEVNKNFPQFVLQEPYSTRYATARDLLAHRTGLPAFGGDLLGKLGYSAEEIIYRVRFIEPATSFRNKAYYSNVGFYLAGQLLEKVANTSYEEFIQKAFFRPLSMTRSGFSANLDKSNVAFAHAWIDGKIQVIPWDRIRGFMPAAGITSTASDMAQWMIMLLNKGLYRGQQILQAKTVQAMFQPSMVGDLSFSEAAPIDENSGFSYGLGWNCYQYQGKMVIEKGGGLDGIRTVVTLLPELKLGITVLSNLNLTMLPEAIRAKFLEIAIGKSSRDLQMEIQEKEKQLSSLLEEDTLEEAKPLGHKLTQYTGLFESDLYGIFTVLLKDDQLVIQAGPEHWEAKLVPWSNDTFLLEWPIINYGHQKVTFTIGPEDEAIQFQTETLGIFRKKS